MSLFKTVEIQMVDCGAAAAAAAVPPDGMEVPGRPMGMATTMHGISIQTLLQSSCAPSMVGRVLSLWGMITRAAPAMGALVYGAASEVVGLQIPVLCGAALCLTVWVRTWRRRGSIAAALEGG